MSLRDNGSLVGGLNGFEDFDGTKAELSKTIGAQPNDKAGRAGGRFQFHFGIALNLLKSFDDLLRLAIDEIEIIAENVDDDRLRFAADGFADAISEEREDFVFDAGKFL